MPMPGILIPGMSIPGISIPGMLDELLDRAPDPGSTLLTDGVVQLNCALSASTCAPAYVDQVIPVADRNSSGNSTHTPTAACQFTVRGRPLRLRSGHISRRGP